ncbi:putative pyruvate kinase [Helianthus annuus]|nr:putative pyruvate kinase [Helianthus annuus]
MAQVVATKLLHNAFIGNGSLNNKQTEKIKPRGIGRITPSHPRLLSVTARRASVTEVVPFTPEDIPKIGEQGYLSEEVLRKGDSSAGVWSKPVVKRKTKIVCTIGPSTDTKEMIWKLAEAGMNVARLNMSHGDHASHQKVIDLVKEYNAQSKDNVIAIMLDTKAGFGPEVRSGDLPQPVNLASGQEFTFTIKRGVGTADCVSVNYDDFVNDVEAGDMLLVDGGMMSLLVKSKTEDSVKCEVVDGGELKSRRHLNVRGKSATLPSITEKDWDDIKFGVDNQVDFYAVSFVKDAEVIHELKNYLKSCGADIQVIPKIESADSIPNLHSIITASDGAMVARGDLGAELPIEEVPLLQVIITFYH